MKRMLFVAIVVSLAVSMTASAAIQVKFWEGQSTGNLAQAEAVTLAGEPTRVMDVNEMVFETQNIDNYVGRIDGFLIAPETGDYTFYIASDDDSGLYLSTDHKVSHIGSTPVCSVSGWAANYNWTAMASQTSAPIALNAGDMYAFKVIYREGTGGDNLSVAWSGPGIGDTPTLISADYVTNDDGFDIKTLTPADGEENVQDVVFSWDYPGAAEDTTYTIMLATPMGTIPLPSNTTIKELGSPGSGLLGYDSVYTWSVAASDGAISDAVSFRTEHQRPRFSDLADTMQPESTAVMLGAPAQLSAKAAAYKSAENMAYQWFKVVDGNGVAIDGATDANLVIAEATLEDDGNYYCEATNSKGTSASDVASLDVQQGLIHRYTFNDGDVADVNGVMMALDVVSGADAVIVNGTGNAVVANGLLTFGNDGSQASNGFAADDPDNTKPDGDYVDLPNGLISSLGAMTVEAWCTWEDDNRGQWQRIFSFGRSVNGEESSNGAWGDPASLVMITPSDFGNLRVEWRSPATALAPGGYMPLHQETLITFVQDDLEGMAKLYLNGIPQGVIETPRTLKSIEDINNWIGRSQWGDTLFIGSFNEFRIYDTSLTTEEVFANYMAGSESMGVVEPAAACEVNVIGDVNNDCVVDLTDAVVLIEQFLLDEYFAEDE